MTFSSSSRRPVPRLNAEQAAWEALRIRDVDGWPRRPWLPVKRYTQDPAPQRGLLHAADEEAVAGEIRVLGHLDSSAPTGGQRPVVATYSSVEDMIADGWIGD